MLRIHDTLVRIRIRVSMLLTNGLNQGYSYYFCLMIEGSGAGSIHLTDGFGSRRPNGSGSTTLLSGSNFLLAVNSCPFFIMSPSCSKAGQPVDFYLYFLCAGAEQCGRHQGHHQEEPGQESESPRQGDQNFKGERRTSWHNFRIRGFSQILGLLF